MNRFDTPGSAFLVANRQAGRSLGSLLLRKGWQPACKSIRQASDLCTKVPAKLPEEVEAFSVLAGPFCSPKAVWEAGVDKCRDSSCLAMYKAANSLSVRESWLGLRKRNLTVTDNAGPETALLYSQSVKAMRRV